jgi:hypothetical protein
MDALTRASATGLNRIPTEDGEAIGAASQYRR